MFVDHYEVLQISPNADSETIRRVYRMQAQRFHPDNLDSGNAEAFRKISDAYEVLIDPQRRAMYDRDHSEAQKRAAIGVPSSPPVMDEMKRREKILSLLYSRRFSNPQQPSLGLRDLEALLNTPKGDLEFSLWYLKECGYLVRSDSAHHTITLKGVQFAEALKTGDAKWIDAASS
ncbi:MAG: J domain-containing protein [Bryobacteraceae bacterium]